MMMMDLLNSTKKDQLNEINFNDVGNISDNVGGFHGYKNYRKGNY